MPQGFHIMAKPMGSICNLQCGYCFYLEKNSMFASGEDFRMSDEVLEAYIQKYITSQDIPEISFVWQGGEPMLAGIPFYQKVLVLQEKYAAGKTIVNSLQTNGILLDPIWCEFLKKYHFMVGISFDGPAAIHNKYRVDTKGSGTFQSVLKSIVLLQEYEIEFNVLVCVSRESCAHGTRIYNFLKGIGVTHIQFTPLVERNPDASALAQGLHYATPTSHATVVTDFSVEAQAYGNFLIEVFDQWIKTDVGTVFIHNIESVLPVWLGLSATMCIYAQTCGDCLIVEHNGDLYSCDHFMYPEYRLGNILTDNPALLVHSKAQRSFGLAKKNTLPIKCQYCEVRAVCGGGCPKHRFVLRDKNTAPIHYLCDGYYAFYKHIGKYMKAIAQLLQNNLPAMHVMELARTHAPLVFYYGCPPKSYEQRGT